MIYMYFLVFIFIWPRFCFSICIYLCSMDSARAIVCVISICNTHDPSIVPFLMSYNHDILYLNAVNKKMLQGSLHHYLDVKFPALLKICRMVLIA